MTERSIRPPEGGRLPRFTVFAMRSQWKWSERMKLTSTEVEQALTQFDGQAIPDNHPVVAQLNRLFGEHTFFLDGHGLNIVEPAPFAGESTRSAQMVNVADWSEADPTRLEPHEPQPTEIVLVLGSAH